MPILIGAAVIAAAILLSTLITAVGTRFAGIESPNEENLWLVDRLTGNVYKCQAPERGKAACEAEVATGSASQILSIALHRSTQKVSPPGNRSGAQRVFDSQHCAGVLFLGREVR